MKTLITGAGGLLGTAVAREAVTRGHDVVACTHTPVEIDGTESPSPAGVVSPEAWSPEGRGAVSWIVLDVTDEAAVAETLGESAADAVVHCAGYTDVDGAEDHGELAMTVNAEGAAHVAAAAARTGSLLLYPSTDYVFDGSAENPYRPDDSPNPVNVYGESKLRGERLVRSAGGSWLVVRTSWLYGSGGPDFIDTVLAVARSGGVVRVVNDQRGRPTWSRSLATALLDLLESPGGAVGRTLHLADRGEATWYDLAAEAFRLTGVRANLVPVTTGEWGTGAPRPRYSVLDLEDAERLLGRGMPRWRESLRSYLVGNREGEP